MSIDVSPVEYSDSMAARFLARLDKVQEQLLHYPVVGFHITLYSFFKTSYSKKWWIWLYLV